MRSSEKLGRESRFRVAARGKPWSAVTSAEGAEERLEGVAPDRHCEASRGGLRAEGTVCANEAAHCCRQRIRNGWVEAVVEAARVPVRKGCCHDGKGHRNALKLRGRAAPWRIDFGLVQTFKQVRINGNQ